MENTKKTENRRIRIFISSTFLDMMEERNELMTYTWPELRRYCRERNIELVEVDLRWGISEEQSSRKETLKLCLNEIENCRPFFISIIGERYGWIPENESFTPDLEEGQKWLKKCKGKSITELEVIHGVINNPKMHNRSFFYFRDPKFIESIEKEKRINFISENSLCEKNLKNLKKTIREFCRINKSILHENYSDSKQLANLVLDDLKAAIQEEFPKQLVPDQLSREAYDQEIFAETRRTLYIKRLDYFEKLDKYINSSNSPLSICGESGSGKSALIANWIYLWQNEHPNDVIIQHYIGSTPYSSDHWHLMKRIMSEIKKWSGDTTDLPDSQDEIIKDFPLWLSIAHHKAEHEKINFIIILDSVDRIQNQDELVPLGWLPTYLFKNSLRLIVSTQSGKIQSALEKKGWETLLVSPLTKDERRRFIKEYLARFGKELEAVRINRIIEEPASEKPLYIKFLLDELRVTGTHDQLDERLNYYLCSKDIPALINKIFKRYESDYEDDRKGLVSESLGLLWAARRGLSENELLRLLKPEDLPQLPPAIWSPLRAALEEELIDNGGILNFSHDFLRAAVEDLFVPSDNKKRELRTKLAKFFEAEPISLRTCDELPWLFLQMNDRSNLKDCILNIDRFQIIFHKEERDLYTYWNWLGEIQTMGSAYKDSFDNWLDSHSNENLRNKSWTAHELGLFLSSTNQFKTAEYLLNIALTFMEKYSGIHASETAHILRSLADLKRELGKLNEAEDLLKRALSIDEYWYDSDDPIRAKDSHALALVLQLKCCFDEAKILLEQALQIEKKHFGDQSIQCVTTITTLADILLSLRKLNEAEKYYNDALEIAHRYSNDNLSTIIMGRIASILQDKGLFSKAELLYNETISMMENLYGSENLEFIYIRNNYATLLFELKRSEEAVLLFKKNLDMLKRILGNNHQNVAKAMSNYAIILNNIRDVNSDYKNEAEIYASDAIRIYESVPESVRNNSEYALALNTLGVVLSKLGRIDEALKNWNNAVSILLIYAKDTGIIPVSLQPILNNFISGLEDKKVPKENIVNRIQDIFKNASAMDLFTKISKSLDLKNTTDNSINNTDWLKVDIRIDLLSKEQRYEIDKVQERLSTHVEFHINRIQQNKNVPSGICEQYREIFGIYKNAISFKISNSILNNEDFPLLKCSSPSNLVLLVASIYSCSKNETVKKLCAQSSEPGFGYLNFFSELFNKWPDPALTSLFHLIICASDFEFECHTGFFDFENYHLKSMKYSILPIELLNEFEKNMLHI